MLQATVARVSSMSERLLIVANRNHLSAIDRQLPEGSEHLLIGEPTPRNTAPAVAAAALLVDPDDVMLVLPADHHFASLAEFRKGVDQALEPAANGYVVTFGIVPTRVEAGYGHIVPAEAVGSGYRIERFVEKPATAEAARLNATGALWNSGMFAFTARLVLAELERHRPGLVETVRRSLPASPSARGEIELGPSFADAESVSLDVAVMEQTHLGLVVPLDAGWSDVGSWASLWELGEPDESGNVKRGRVLALGTKGSYLRSDGPVVAAIDVEDLVVVATPDAVLVARRGSAQDVKKIVELLETEDGARNTEDKPDDSSNESELLQ